MQLPVAGSTALVIFPPSALSARIDPWMRAYNPYRAIIAPHITLAYRGFAALPEWRAVRGEFAAVLSAFRPFDITLKTTGTFEGEDFVLWLKPEDDGSLLRLRAALAEKFPAFFPAGPHPFVPHLSIGFFETRAALRQAQARVQAELTPLRFRAAAVTFMVFGADGKWGDSDELPLGEK